jgi:hypothetical protein
MKCPKCGGEMEEGYSHIKGPYGGEGWWSVEKPGYHKLWKMPNLDPPRGAIKIMDTSREEDFAKEGFRCPKCRVIIFNYGEEKEG